jgi:hypothetical protein
VQGQDVLVIASAPFEIAPRNRRTRTRKQAEIEPVYPDGGDKLIFIGATDPGAFRIALPQAGRVRTAAAVREGDAMSFGLYSIGFAIVIGGLIYAAYLMHIPTHWIAVGAVVLLGIGILSGVKATRQKDPVG